MSESSTDGRGIVSRVYVATGTAGGLFLAYLGWMGRSYYMLPAAERPLHQAHALLRSSGGRGLPYGIIGLGLIVLNLGYLARRALPRGERFGSLRSWMSMHVFTGLIGSMLILLHSAFLPRSPMGTLSSLALWIVVATGLIGRYIYAHVPRSMQGRELELEELKRLLEERRRALAERGLGVQAVSGAADHTRRGVAAALAAMVKANREAAREYESLRAAVAASPELLGAEKDILPLAKRFVREKQWLARYEELRDLMGAWRFFHRWFAIIMLTVAICHVLVATGLGGLKLGVP